MSIEDKVRYCALTTLPISMKQFVLPSLINMSNHGYQVFAGCQNDESFAHDLPDEISYVPLDIVRGFSFKKTLKSIGQLISFFKKYKIDMVEYGTENMAFCAAIASWIARVPVRIYNHWGARYIGYTGVRRQISLTIERTAALFSTDVRQVSSINMDMCINDSVYPRDKVKVLGNGGTVGVDFSVFDLCKKEQYRHEIREKYDIPDDATVFGFVGRIQRDKGINELIEAFRFVYDIHDNVYLMLVGQVDSENPINPDNMEWARKCNRVVFTGRVTDVQRYISSFDIMTHPTYREGFGMVLQEAGALKIAIITTNIPGPSEFIQNQSTGVLVEAKSVNELESAMIDLLVNVSKRINLADRIYEYTKENFERSVMLHRILEDRNNLREKRLQNA